MDSTTKLRILRNMTEAEENDEVLAAYLDSARELILNIVYPTERNRASMDVPSMYEMKQIEIAAYLVNKRGAEGEIQHIENGTHSNYGSSDVPEAMIRHITPFCGVVK